MARQRHCRPLARNGKPAASLLTPSSSEPRTPAGKARVLDARKWLRERDGLAAGGRWIRTGGTAAQKPWISAAFRALRGYRPGGNLCHLLVRRARNLVASTATAISAVRKAPDGG